MDFQLLLRFHTPGIPVQGLKGENSEARLEGWFTGASGEIWCENKQKKSWGGEEIGGGGRAAFVSLKLQDDDVVTSAVRSQKRSTK